MDLLISIVSQYKSISTYLYMPVHEQMKVRLLISNVHGEQDSLIMTARNILSRTIYIPTYLHVYLHTYTYAAYLNMHGYTYCDHPHEYSTHTHWKKQGGGKNKGPNSKCVYIKNNTVYHVSFTYEYTMHWKPEIAPTRPLYDNATHYMPFNALFKGQSSISWHQVY